MKLLHVDKAIETCQSHIKNTVAGSEIEAYLTRNLLILICVCFEEKVESLVVDRAARSSDPSLGMFVKKGFHRIFRGLKTSDIAKFLSHFGDNHKEHFRRKLENNEQAETFFNNIVTNRNEVAHTTNLNISFLDLVHFYSEGHLVLDAIKDALNSDISANRGWELREV